MARRAGRRPPVPDFELWNKVTETVTPLHKRAKSSTTIASGQVSGGTGGVAPKQVMDAKPAGATRQPQPVVRPPGRPTPLKPPVPKGPPPLSGIDRRTGQKLLRGQVAIEARIDLHGESLETARVKLFAYLSQAFERGHRFVIVITGKGSAPFSRHTLHGLDTYDTPERGGRIRRAVPEWFSEAQFRRIVSGYQPAHPKHGGGGALYVRLRKNPDHRK